MEKGFVAGVGGGSGVGGFVSVGMEVLPGVSLDEMPKKHIPDVGVQVVASWNRDWGSRECAFGNEASAFDGRVDFIFEGKPQGQVSQDRDSVVDASAMRGEHGDCGVAVLGENEASKIGEGFEDGGAPG